MPYSLLQHSCVTNCNNYISTAAQRKALHLKFTSLQYCNAVFGAEMEIRPLL